MRPVQIPAKTSGLSIHSAQKVTANASWKWMVLLAITCVVIVLIYLFVADYYDRGQYYSMPLQERLELAGSFGEVRPGHFHTGLDLRTGGRENLPVYAVADGFISRLQVQPDGYGKAVFIQHKNGATSVYGHLNSFIPEAQQLIATRQYATEQWQQDITLDSVAIPVQKGSLIGYSGNTGNSKGPHLHFELRNTSTGILINPLLQGFNIDDREPPVIQQLYWYDRKRSIYNARSGAMAVKGKDGLYKTVNDIVYVSSSQVGLGIQVYDKVQGLRFRLGIHKASVYVDDSLLYVFTIDGFPVADSRYVNAGIDYERWLNNRTCVQYLFRLPGNELPSFHQTESDGTLKLYDRKIHRVKIVVSDGVGNASELHCRIRYDAYNDSVLPAPKQHLYYRDFPHWLQATNASAGFVAKAFYDNVPLAISESYNAGKNKASVLVRLQPETIPVHDSFTVYIKTSLPAGSKLRDRTVMQLTTGKQSFIQKGVWEKDRMKARFDKIGTLQLLVDTIPPSVQCNMSSGNRDQHPSIAITCRDNLGRIAAFRAELDGKWICYDMRGKQPIIQPVLTDQDHQLVITVTDIAGNTIRKSWKLKPLRKEGWQLEQIK